LSYVSSDHVCSDTVYLLHLDFLKDIMADVRTRLRRRYMYIYTFTKANMIRQVKVKSAEYLPLVIARPWFKISSPNLAIQ